MVVYALFATGDHGSGLGTGFLGLYTTRALALTAAGKFLQSPESRTFDEQRDCWTFHELYLQPRELDAPSPIGPWDANDQNEWLEPSWTVEGEVTFASVE